MGMDAYVHSASFAKDLNEAFEGAAKDMDDGDATNGCAAVIAEIDTLDGKPNMVDAVWDGRPALPKNPFRVHVCS